MLFKKKLKKLMTWLPAAALVLSAGIGFSCSQMAGEPQPVAFRTHESGESVAESGKASPEPVGSGASGSLLRDTSQASGADGRSSSYDGYAKTPDGESSGQRTNDGAASGQRTNDGEASGQRTGDGAASGLTASSADGPSEVSSDAATSSAGGAEGKGEAAEPGASESKAENLIWVHVCGAVAVPGVYELPGGSRIKDAIDAAGGFSGEADENCLNLAMPVYDAVKVYVPAQGEPVDVSSLYGAGSSGYGSGGAFGLFGYGDSQGNAGAGGSGGGAGTSSGGSGYGGLAGSGAEIGSGSSGYGSSAGTASDSKININTASVQELIALPGIGQAKAEAIVAYREKHGSFQKPEDLMKVSGIGKGIYEKLASKIETGG